MGQEETYGGDGGLGMGQPSYDAYPEIKVTPKKNNNWTLKLILVGLILVVLCGLIYWGVSASVSSVGYCDGYVQNLTYKGTFWKSYEGELAKAGFNQTGLGSVWFFSCEDENVANQIQKINGKDFVRLHYEKHRWTGWFHDQPYRVNKIEVLIPAQSHDQTPQPATR